MTAGAEILAQRGYEGLTVAAVCERAKVATGSIYNRVRSKDALLHMIATREIERMIADFRAAEAASALPTATMSEHIRREVVLVTHPARSDPALWRTFLLRRIGDPSLFAITQELVRVLHLQFTSSLLARRAELAHPDPERAVEFCYDLLAGSLVRKLTVHYEDEALDEGWERFCDEHAELFGTYLRVRQRG